MTSITERSSTSTASQPPAAARTDRLRPPSEFEEAYRRDDPSYADGPTEPSGPMNPGRFSLPTNDVMSILRGLVLPHPTVPSLGDLTADDHLSSVES